MPHATTRSLHVPYACINVAKFSDCLINNAVGLVPLVVWSRDPQLLWLVTAIRVGVGVGVGLGVGVGV